MSLRSEITSEKMRSSAVSSTSVSDDKELQILKLQKENEDLKSRLLTDKNLVIELNGSLTTAGNDRVNELEAIVNVLKAELESERKSKSIVSDTSTFTMNMEALRSLQAGNEKLRAELEMYKRQASGEIENLILSCNHLALILSDIFCR